MSISTVAADVVSPTYTYSTPTTTSTGGGIAATWLAVSLVVAIMVLVGLWRTFQKAGRPGWAAIIPIYNIYTMVKVAGRPGWWTILYFIPFINLIVHIIVSVDVAKAFGRSDVFGIVGLWLFSFVGYLMLGFGDAKYTAPAR